MEKKTMNAQTLKALSVVCNHTTLPLVEQQAQEIKKLKARLKSYRKMYNSYENVRDWMEGFGYDEEYDKDMIREGEAPFFRAREDYDDDDIF